MLKKAELRDVINLCGENNPAAQSKLYKAFYGPLITICMRYANNYDDAVEALNVGFLKIFENCHKWEGNVAKFYPWCSYVMVNCSLDKLRKAKTKSIRLEYLVPDCGVVDNYAVSSLEEGDLLKLINELPTNSRTVFNLYVFENYNHREISELLKIKEHTSQWHLMNARTILKNRINYLEKKELGKIAV